MINVFISHSHKDKMIARTLARKLNQYGIYAWIDEAEIKIGDSLIDKIRDGIDKVDYLIALISADSVESEWVKKELDIAMNREIESKRVVVIPVLTGKCELPGFLKGKLYADMTSNKKINKNFPLLLSRFNVGYVENIKELFTEFSLTVTQVIEKLEKDSEFEKIELLESISHEDSDLFKIDTFINCINNMMVQESKNADLILSILEACYYCPSKFFFKLNLKVLLDNNIDEVIFKTLEVAQGKKTLKLFDEKVFLLLKRNNVNYEIKKAIIEYFTNTNIDSKLAKQIYNYVIEKAKIENNIDNILFLKLLCKLVDEGDTDRIVDIICKNYYLIEDDIRNMLISDICNYGIKSFIYIRNPRISCEFMSILSEIILNSDDEEVKSSVGLFLIIGDTNFINTRQEVWKLIDNLDNYSLEMLLFTLDSEYNIGYIFNSDIDVEAFVRLMGRNLEIKNMVESIITQIHLKSAIDVIEKYSIDLNYNYDDILFTLLKETNVTDYAKLLKEVEEKINSSSFKSEWDCILLEIAKYKLGNSIDSVIKSLDFVGENLDLELFYNRMKAKLIVEELEDIEINLNRNEKIKIRSFIKNLKSAYKDIL